MENWKSIDGYVGYYEISDHGRIRSIERVTPKFLWGSYVDCKSVEKIIKPIPDHNGYLRVGLSKLGKVTGKAVSRLVAEAFIENENNYPCVLHNDDDPKNNNSYNLSWGTHKQNSMDAAKRGRFNIWNVGHIGAMSKVAKPVIQKDENGVIIKEWDCARDAHRNGFSYKSISACCSGLRKTHNGFYWSFKNPVN